MGGTEEELQRLSPMDRGQTSPRALTLLEFGSKPLEAVVRPPIAHDTGDEVEGKG